MEKRFFAMLVLVLSAVAFTSCEYDDSGLWDKVNSLQEQVTANQEDIATLTSLVEALNKGKVIVATTQTDNGYTLTFSDGILLMISLTGFNGIRLLEKTITVPMIKLIRDINKIT